MADEELGWVPAIPVVVTYHAELHPGLCLAHPDQSWMIRGLHGPCLELK